MRIIPHTDEMVQKAEVMASDLGALRNSITGGQGNIAGYLGECAVAQYIDATMIPNDRDYDLIKSGRRIEIKTKRRTVPPKLDYDVSIAETSTHQKPDLYIFVSLEFGGWSVSSEGHREYHDLKHVWLLGKKDPDAYFSESSMILQGDVDGRNNFVTHRNMYNHPIRRLDPVELGESQLRMDL